jgi:hypothetical protein
MSANEAIAEHNREDEAFFDEAFTNTITRQPQIVPEDIKRLSIRLCRAYGIRGICDPMYIANVIAFELGLGDGCGKFDINPQQKKI